MGLAKELNDADKGFEIVARHKMTKLPIILSEADPEGCAACSMKVNPANAYRNGTLYPSYTAAAYKGLFELAARRKVNLISMLSWSFEFENKDYFEGFRSLSTNTIFYKALTGAEVLHKFYLDLQNPAFSTRFAMFHRRFSTNTRTSWDKAQPFRLIAMHHDQRIRAFEPSQGGADCVGKVALVGVFDKMRDDLGELIKELESRTSGYYSPSPGVIYPALTYLEEAGHAEPKLEGTRKAYKLTDEGRGYLRKERSGADADLHDLSGWREKGRKSLST